MLASRRFNKLIQQRALERVLLGCLQPLSHDYATSAQPRDPHSSPRWYKQAQVEPSGPQGEHQIKLDGRAVRTPGLKYLVLPSRLLALAIAAGWQWQEAGKIRAHTMPLMSLAATAIDQPKPREAVIETLMSFLDTDSLCCRIGTGPVAELQRKMLDPVLHQIQESLQTTFDVGDSIFGCQQPEATAAAVERHLNGLDRWRLAATDSASGACRSVLMGIAIVQGWMSVEHALTLARLEEQVNIDDWGLVEGGHDIDAADILVRISAPSVLVRLLSDPAHDSTHDSAKDSAHNSAHDSAHGASSKQRTKRVAESIIKNLQSKLNGTQQ